MDKRIIKFRAYNHWENKLFFPEPEDLGLIINGDYDGLELAGQFTGLLDKNGREIYEGDTIQFTLRGLIGRDCKGKVYFCEDLYSWAILTSPTGYIHYFEQLIKDTIEICDDLLPI